MPNIPVSTECLPIETLPEGATSAGSQSSAIPSDGSLQHKAVQLGSLEPALLTLAKQSVLPSMVLVVLLLAMCAFDQKILTPKFYALVLISFVLCKQIFSPLALSRSGGDDPTRAVMLGFLLEWSCVVAMLAFLAVSFDLTHAFSWDAIVTWFIATPLARILVNSLSVLVAKRLASDDAFVQRFIIIGANELGVEFARRIKRRDDFGKFVGFFDYRGSERLTGVKDNRVTGNCRAADFGDFVRNNSIARVYIALPISAAPRMEDLLRELRDTTATVYFVPNLFAFDLLQARCVAIDGMLAFSICDSPMQGMSALWKRVLDVAGAWFALLLTWPAFIVIAIAIKRSSPGPVFFKQRRYGLNGEEILVYKFRSMTVCEDGSVVKQASKLDGRVTPVGAFLRRTSLDELPQIINVLEGKMSFVGPRPHAVAHNEEYRKLISGYMIRHKVRPGITGWAQVNGSRGETSTVEKMRERVQYDLYYLKNWSLRLDLRIIAKTVWTVVADRNAY
jgi:putative colanic acid biosynthesis UDP-glucose lipid carrier transferase